LLRRSEDMASPGSPTRLGSLYLDDGRHDVNGQFFDGSARIRLFVAPGTGPTTPGTLEGTQIEARLDFSDIYNATGVTLSGDRVTLSRFTTRFAALWEQADAAPWQARHGMDADTYQQTFDTLVADGFRLTSVCGYSEGTGSRFNAVWVKSDGPPFQARHGLSAADYQATFDSLVAQGFRLTSISGYAETGQARYAAIWEQRPGPDWQARHGLSRQQYQQAFDEMAAQGYALVQVSGYRVGVEIQNLTVDLNRHRLNRREDVLGSAGLRPQTASAGSQCGAEKLPLGGVPHRDDLECAVIGSPVIFTEGRDLGHLIDVREDDAVEAFTGSVGALNLERAELREGAHRGGQFPQ